MAGERDLGSELLERLEAIAEFALGPVPSCDSIDSATVDDELRKAKIDPEKLIDTFQDLLADAKAREDRTQAARQRENVLKRATNSPARHRSSASQQSVRQFYRGLVGVSDADLRSLDEDEALLDQLEAYEDEEENVP